MLRGNPVLAAKDFAIRAILPTVECAARGAGPPGPPVLPGPARRGTAAVFFFKNILKFTYSFKKTLVTIYSWYKKNLPLLVPGYIRPEMAMGAAPIAISGLT